MAQEKEHARLDLVKGRMFHPLIIIIIIRERASMLGGEHIT